MSVKETDGSRLKRQLGTWTTTLFTAGMIVGTGIFAAFGAATSAAGSGILVAMILGGTVALATGISAAQLGVNIPEEGGAFTWARAFNHPTIGFVAGSGYLGKALVSMSVVALAFATYIAQAIPWLPGRVAASLAILVCTVLNIFGIEVTSRVLIGLLLVAIALLAVFTGAALHAVDPANFLPLLGNKGPIGMLTGAAIFFWSWDGFMRAAIMTSEIKNPRQAIPIGIAGGMAIAAIVYLTVGAVTLGVLGANKLARLDTPLLAAAQRAASWTFWLVLAAAIVATVEDLFGVLLAASRVGLAMSEAHEMPRWLGKVHDRFQTPYRSVLALGVASAALTLLFDLRSLIEVASAFMLVWYLVVHYAALQVPRTKRIASPIFAWYGIAGCVVLIIALPRLAVVAAGVALAILAGIRWLVRRTIRADAA